MGMDSREVTPELVRAVVYLAVEVRSFGRAETATWRVLGRRVSQSTIRRLVHQVGGELAEWAQQEQPANDQQVTIPRLAVVSCDGGRIRTRVPGQGRGVHPSGENGWRETKNASLERMSLPENVSGDDPCPGLPTSFRSAENVANIAEKPVPNVDRSDEDKNTRVVYQGPRRVLRTVVSSMACSEQFGPMMKREARRRRFFDAPLRAFLGDGLNWNWSIWKEHFPTFVPVLDFVHAIHYVFAAAMCIGSDESEGWTIYKQYVTLCWQGRVDLVIEKLIDASTARGVDLQGRIADEDPNKPLADAVRYLTNNRSRMDYPAYRRAGLPVTSSAMESLIKQINQRVKGTEMFWDDPQGAETILHLRAAALSEDDRLDRHLSRRPGWPFLRRSTIPTTAT